MSTSNYENKISLLCRQLLLSGLSLCLPALAKEEFATLHFIPDDSSRVAQFPPSRHKSSRNGSRGSVKRVVIDPGHGGKDPGAIGHRGSEEKHVVLEIAKNIRTLLKHRKGYSNRFCNV